MKKLALMALMSIGLANAAVLTVVIFPVRHPLKVVKTVVKIATYPVRHPIKTLK